MLSLASEQTLEASPSKYHAATGAVYMSFAHNESAGL